MEQLVGAISECGSFLNSMYSSNEEADFMAQLLNLPSDHENCLEHVPSSGGFWLSHESEIPFIASDDINSDCYIAGDNISYSESTFLPNDTSMCIEFQNLVPNGTKVDISTMLEEAVQYVKFLQLQIKLLSSDDMWMYAPIAYNGMSLSLGLDLQIAMPR